jgi:hypothetical protein
MWMDLLSISVFSTLSYVDRMGDQDVCGMSVLFSASVIVFLMCIYSFLSPYLLLLVGDPAILPQFTRQSNCPPIFVVEDPRGEDRLSECDHPCIEDRESSTETFELSESDNPNEVYRPAVVSPLAYTPRDIWVGVYTFGLGSFCMFYSIHSDDPTGNAVMCSCWLWVMTTEFYRDDIAIVLKENPLASKAAQILRGLKSNKRVFVFVPVIFLLYTICTFLLSWNAFGSFLNTGWYVLPNIVCAIFGPLMITRQKFKSGARDALGLSMPIYSLCAMCVICTATAMPDMQCSWGILWDTQGDILWGKVAIWLVLPVCGLCMTWGVVSACNSGNSINIGVILLTLSCARLVNTTVAPMVLSGICLVILLSVQTYHSVYFTHQ